jgi:CheY-like chemotaxis protein
MSLLVEILSGTGLKILNAINAAEAIQKAQEYLPDLILMDIGLPDMKGYDATRIILSKTPKLKVVAQTAYASSSDRTEALNAGCIDHISKPIKEQALLALINKYLP